MASQTRGSSRAVPSFGCAVQPAVTSADHGVSAAIQRAVGHASLNVGMFNIGTDHVDGAHQGGVFQPAASSQAVQDLVEDDVGAIQPAVLSNAVQKLIEDVRKFGRLPRTNKKRTSDEEKAEDKLYLRWRKHKKSIPEDTKMAVSYTHLTLPTKRIV